MEKQIINPVSVNDGCEENDTNLADEINNKEIINLDPLPLKYLGVKVMDQTSLERRVAQEADNAMLEKDIEIETKRLHKAVEKFNKYSTKLRSLEAKLNTSNRISDKESLKSEIKNLEENELTATTQDIKDIRHRLDNSKIKKVSADKSTDSGGAVSVQQPTETKEEYLIRIGKVTAFGSSNAFIQDKDMDYKAPTHRDLILPGLSNIRDVEITKETDLKKKTQKDKVFETHDDNDEDYSSNYDDNEYILDLVNKDLDYQRNTDQESNESDEGEYKVDIIKTSKSKINKLPEEDFKNIDDGNEAIYQRRLKHWIDQRLALRIKNRPDYVDDPSVPEWQKPHPTINDAILNDNFRIPGDIFPSLFDYQKTCVQWLWELYSQKTGGIIGDEMGLGKTVEMISFLAGLHYSGDLKGPILIVCPATVLKQWCNEFHRWWPPLRTVILHSIGEGMNKKKGKRKLFDDDFSDSENYLLDEDYGLGISGGTSIGKINSDRNAQNLVNRVVEKGNVIITTYVGVRIYSKYLLPVQWGYVVLDEGHKIRNPDSHITLSCKQLKTPNRIILSGTPIQNNLIELWSLFDFVFPGRLGTLPVFQKQFCVPINLGGYANATNVQVQAGYKCAVILRDLISPYLLRRVKADVAKDLPKKSEMVLFCTLTSAQRKLYQDFVESSDLKKILNGKRNALYGIDILRKICNYPDLVDFSVKNKLKLKKESVEDICSKSGKIQVVTAFLELWNKENRKTLIFTQTKQMLDILQNLLDAINLECDNQCGYMRMDGSTPISQRQTLVDDFNTNPEYKVFLLTTRVGGLGVNLTGASRVIIYDPDWNPSTDMQARERAWRLGQKQDVIIYRLMIAGSIEEKIYHRQIFKQFLTDKILKDPKQKRFFKMTDLYDLFTLGDDDVKGTETADLFGANETNFDGSRERKSRFFKSRNKKSNNLRTLQKEGDDFLQASRIKGVASMQEYKVDQPQSTMFSDADSAVDGGTNTTVSGVMSKLLKNSGVHSALEHDSILEQGSSKSSLATDSSTRMIENEANRIANDAVNALRASRNLTKKTNIAIPTWTGKYGAAGRVSSRNEPKKRRAIDVNKSKSVSRFSVVENSSASILGNIQRKKNEVKKRSIIKKTENIANQLSSYMSGLNGCFSTSKDILDNLNIDVSDEKLVKVIRSMLKDICKWDKERKGWILNDEFR